MSFKIFLSIIVFFSFSAWPKIKVVTTTPDLSYLVKMIGGSEVEVFSLLEGTEDPHFIDAVPLFIQKSASADLFVQVGLGLEVGWAPRVLQKSGNRKIQEGSNGFCSVGSSIDVLEKVTGNVNRSMGDVHGEGNPHFHLSPKQYQQAANKVFECLKYISPKQEAVFSANLKELNLEIERTIIEVKSILAKSKGKLFAEYHKQFLYYFNYYQLSFSTPIEEIPGVPPSAGRIAERAKKAKEEGLFLVIAADHQNDKVLKKFKELSGVNFIKVPAGLRDNFSKNAYYELQISLARKLAGE